METITTVATTVAETAAGIGFTPENLAETAPIMGKGMLGIFIVTALIVLVVNALNNIPEKNRRNILIIGDSQSSDILGGINSEIDTCWFNPNNDTAKYESKYTIFSLEEIKNIL